MKAALAEDIGGGDSTTLAIVPRNLTASAVMRARQQLIVAGTQFAGSAFRALSRNIKVEAVLGDGRRAAAGAGIMKVCGPARAILSAERVALNFIQRLSGIATLTSEFVQATRGTRAKILDTRKTTPGWRRFEKYAVARGGGTNHRMGLDDMVLIKDNHLAALREQEANAIATAIARARREYPKLKIEVEAESLDQVRRALNAGAEMILLDNMNLKDLSRAVAMARGIAKTEASGGVNLKTVRAIAETGVDFISVGALTHSAPAVDIGLDFEE
ncbi:MAG: carboxylating nicotinate-nucleotide diphosphorylase [Limisphaerales bacterium]